MERYRNKSGHFHFTLSTDPADYKAPNKKGVRHHRECFNDEVGVTICICNPIRPTDG